MTKLPNSQLTTKKGNSLEGGHVFHITQHLAGDQAFLTRVPVFESYKQEMIIAAERAGVALLHYSIQATHIHIMIRCDTAKMMFSMMHRLNSGFGKRVHYLKDSERFLTCDRVFGERPAYRIIKGTMQLLVCARYIYRNRPDENKGGWWASSSWDFEKKNPGFRMNDNLFLGFFNMSWPQMETLFNLPDKEFLIEAERIASTVDREKEKQFFMIDRDDEFTEYGDEEFSDG